ncbi:hypothetical protein [Flavicella sediminum]|uniref:hypothetical protein n=1 Tax=Flavicella sediminum TaxID=2585141 RepID=UPI001122BF60|nr:hypothetical protein [Flavicella sediminum]
MKILNTILLIILLSCNQKDNDNLTEKESFIPQFNYPYNCYLTNVIFKRSNGSQDEWKIKYDINNKPILYLIGDSDESQLYYDDEDKITHMIVKYPLTEYYHEYNYSNDKVIIDISEDGIIFGQFVYTYSNNEVNTIDYFQMKTERKFKYKKKIYWNNQNISKIELFDEYYKKVLTTDYSYDDKINPFYILKPFNIGKPRFASLNNVTAYSNLNWTYKYNNDKFPVMADVASHNYTFTYKCE